MKTNKEQVYNILKLHHMQGQPQGASAQSLSKLLGFQRSNVSAILNSLAAEGLVVKSGGRPVLYYAKRSGGHERDCFANLVGHDGSLKRAVQLARAAVLYPQGGMSTLICGQHGTGKKFLAQMMHRYALDNGVIPPGSPCHMVDCARHTTDGGALLAHVFGAEGVGTGCYAAARHGVLVIAELNLVDTSTAARLLEGLLENEAEDAQSIPLVIVLCTGNPAVAAGYRKKLPVSIDLPALAERPLEERKFLIQNLLTLEAARAKRTVVINAELMRCLLLYDTDINVARLKYDIKLACANAYVRERAAHACAMNLYIGDFDSHVRKGFLKYKTYRDEVERIIPADYSYRFSESNFEMTAVDRDKLKDKTLYNMIDRRAAQLADKGLSPQDVSLLLVAELEPQFALYQKALTDQVLNTEHLSKMVDARVIAMVREFLVGAAEKLGEVLPQSVLFGMCLHIDATLRNQRPVQTLDASQICEIVENYRAEYTLCLQLAKRIENEFGVVLPVDEVVLLTMFLCFKDAPQQSVGRPVVLYALHGEGLAAAMAAAVNTASGMDNTYHYELPCEENPETFYQSLCDTIRKIDKGRGVVVLYDMEYLTRVFSTIYNETGIELRLIPMHATRVGVELSRWAAAQPDVDVLYQDTLHLLRESLVAKPLVIVTLCTTGEGGALQLQQYLEKHGELRGTRVVPLAMAQRDKLREDLSALMENSLVQCLVGPQNPELFGIPFIPVGEVFTIPPGELPALLRRGRQPGRAGLSAVDYEAVYAYLGEHLTHLSIPKLKKLLPVVIDGIKADITPLALDTEIGLFLHIPCCVERMLAKGNLPVSIQKTQIIERYKEGYKKLIRIFKPMEKAFGVIFNDDELAIVLTIIYKL